MPNLLQLKTILRNGNDTVKAGFFNSGGAAVLIKCISDRISHVMMSDLDVAVLYEVLSCCKTLMNTKTGMEGLLRNKASKNIVEVFARCLLFEWKPVALQVLEILAVCCFYSAASCYQVLEGLRTYSKSLREPNYAFLSRALVEQDVEIKTAGN